MQQRPRGKILRRTVGRGEAGQTTMTTDTRIVTSTYRYKRPPRKRKAVALEVPAIVRVKRSPPGRMIR